MRVNTLLLQPKSYYFEGKILWLLAEDFVSIYSVQHLHEKHLAKQEAPGLVEVRDSQTGYFIPLRSGLGVWSGGSAVGVT